MLFFLILKYKHSFELLGFLLPKKILCVNLEEFCPTVLAIKKEGKCSFCISLYHIKYFAKVMRIFTKVMRIFTKVMRLFTRKFRVIRQFAKVSSYFEEVMRFFATFSCKFALLRKKYNFFSGENKPNWGFNSNINLSFCEILGSVCSACLHLQFLSTRSFSLYYLVLIFKKRANYSEYILQIKHIF